MTRPQRKRALPRALRAMGVRNFTERVSEGHEKGANVVAYTWGTVSRSVYRVCTRGTVEPDISRDKVNSRKGKRAGSCGDRTVEACTRSVVYFLRRKGENNVCVYMKRRRNALEP